MGKDCFTHYHSSIISTKVKAPCPTGKYLVAGPVHDSFTNVSTVSCFESGP